MCNKKEVDADQECDETDSALNRKGNFYHEVYLRGSAGVSSPLE